MQQKCLHKNPKSFPFLLMIPSKTGSRKQIFSGYLLHVWFGENHGRQPMTVPTVQGEYSTQQFSLSSGHEQDDWVSGEVGLSPCH